MLASIPGVPASAVTPEGGIGQRALMILAAIQLFSTRLAVTTLLFASVIAVFQLLRRRIVDYNVLSSAPIARRRL